MRVAGLGLQADLDRDLVDEVGDVHAVLRQVGADLLYVPFAQVEPHPDRLELHDGRKLARLIAAHQLADRHLARRHHAVEGGRNGGVAEIDLGGLGVGLRLQHVGVRGVTVGARLVEVGLGRDVLCLQLLLAL